MNLRGRAASLLAAAVLSLGIVAGAGAQSVGTSITLDDSDGCTATLTSSTIDFGTYMWDGTTGTYKKPTGTSEGSFGVTAVSSTYASGEAVCSVELTASPLKNDSGAEIANAIILTYPQNAEITGNPISLNVRSGKPTTISATLSSAFLQSIQEYGPGTYSGTITVTGATSST